ncbi:MAG TPA: imidazolonepropionase, partial [Mycobacterium sp.]|nr:imidazolonepropionase [Mycobacterium sp.]
MTVLYTDIRELVTNDPANADGDPLGVIADAALVVDGANIAWVGRRTEAPEADDRVSCADTSVIPGFVDSHAHLVFAGERSAEFAARMCGQPYGAGGISSTVNATRKADDATLLAGVQRLADELLRAGVTTFECKSGYGLTVDDEARSLQIAKAVTDETTFLGAHVVPVEYRDDRAAYIDLVTGPMLQACAPHGRWVDVFCDSGAFDVDESRHILTEGMKAGLDAR